MTMGSTHKPKTMSLGRRVVAIFAAVCMVASMWPAAALGYPAYVEDFPQASDEMASATGGNGSITSTDVKVAVTSDFRVAVDNEEAIAIEDARKLASGDYVLAGTLEHGVPFSDGAGVRYYEYKWTRQKVVAGQDGAAATLVDDAAYNDALTWTRADVQDAEIGTTRVTLNLYDVRDTLDFDNQAQYVYTLVGRDKALERASSSTVLVACTAHYKDATISTEVAAGTIWAAGLMHIGDPQLFATELTSASPAYGLIQQSAEGRAIDGAYDLSITEQQAANEDNGHTAYLEPLSYIQIPLSAAVPEGAEVKVLGIFASGSRYGTLQELTDVAVFTDEDGARYVQVNSGAVEGDDAGALVCGVFAVAYQLQPSDPAYKPPVNVTSQVAGAGGLIDIVGTHAFAQGATVRYTFLPTAGFALDYVEVIEGDLEAPTSVRTYRAGVEQDNFRSNWLDYTVSPSNTRAPEDITIIAHFAEADLSGIEGETFIVTATSNDAAKGSATVEGGSLMGGLSLAKVRAGGAATIHFTPVETSVLDYVEVITGEGDAQVIERPQVLNSTLTLPAVCADTNVVAHFEYGTPVMFPDVNISYADTDGGSFADGNPTVRPYGESTTVNVQADEGYKIDEVWFTFDDDPDTRYPLRYTGSGISWIIDYTLKDLTVHATFAPSTLPVRVVANEGGSVVAAYDGAGGTATTESIAASEAGVVLALDPDSGLELSVVPDDTKTVEVALVPAAAGAALVPIAGEGGRYSISNAQLTGDVAYVKVEFRDAVVGPVPPDPVEEFFWVTPHIVGEDGAEVAGEAAHGTVSPGERFQVGKGGTATFSFKPDEGYRAEVTLTPSAAGSWVVADKLNYSIFDIQADTDVYVRFVADPTGEVREEHTITASVFGDVGGTISPAGEVRVAHLGYQAFSFVADEGYALSYVIIDADTDDERIVDATGLNSAGQYMFTGVSADHTITAVFATDGQLADIVVWEISAGEGGSATPSGRVPCRISERGRSVIIIPDEGHVIAGITIEERGHTPREVNLATDAAFDGSVYGGTYLLPTVAGGGGQMRVSFEPRAQQVAIHVNVKGQGGSASPNGDSTASVGAEQTITFVAHEGYALDYARFTNREGTPLTNGDFTQAAIAGSYSYTFTVNGETWIECAFRPLSEGEQPPVEPGSAIALTAVSVGTGKISPHGRVELYPEVEGSKVTFWLLPDVGSKLVQLTVGDVDVTNQVVGGQFTLLARDAHDGDEVRAIFETIEPVRGKVELTAGSGGQISPAGTVDVVVGDRLPLSFLPAEGMCTDALAFTYQSADGTTWTTTRQLFGQTNYAIGSVSADLIEVHVTFKQGASPRPAAYTVRAKVADDSRGLGSVSPDEGKLVTVNQGGAALFVFTPEPGYRVKSVTLNGGANLISGGSTAPISYYVAWNELAAVRADATTAVLEVAFEKIAVNPDWVNIVVGVQTNATPGARSGIESGAGGFVSPSELTVEYASADEYEFYVLPDDGYVIDTITASVDGGAECALDYNRKDHTAQVNDIQAIAEGRADAGAGSTGGGAGSGAGTGAGDSANDAGSARYYTFELTNIVGNVNVKVNFRSLGEGDADDAMNGEGERVELTVGASEGGTVSPSGTVTLPAGCTYPFAIMPDSDVWVPTAIVISYADGTTKLIEDVRAGRFPITIEPGMTGIYVSFEQIGSPVQTVRITASAEGPGEIAPCGGFNVAAGTSSQSFSLKYASERACLQSLTVKTAGGEEMDMVELGAVWKFDTEFTLWNVKADTEVHAVFAEGSDDNPAWGEVEYVPVRAYATTEGEVSTAGGVIEPTSTVATGGVMQFVRGSKQVFQFRPMRGYVVSAVVVTTGSGDDARVRTLSAEEIASRQVVLEGIDEPTSVVVDFVGAYYEVDVASGEGGSFYPEGTGIKVRQGERLELVAVPDADFELDAIETGGLVVHEEPAASALQGQIAQVASLGARAASDGERHTFAVAGAGSVFGTFKSVKSPVGPDNPSEPSGPDDPSGPDNPDNPSGPNNPSTPGGPGNAGDSSSSGSTSDPSGTDGPNIVGGNTKAPGTQCSVKVSSSGNGTVTPAGEMTIVSGSILTLTLTPAVGFYPASITVKDALGTRTIANASRTYSAKVTGDCELIANFATTAAPGSSNPLNRTVRTLQSLAKTGDNAYAAMLALAAVACAGVGVMILTSKRRRKEQEARD